jgi:uncharacterized protein YkwD
MSQQNVSTRRRTMRRALAATGLVLTALATSSGVASATMASADEVTASRPHHITPSRKVLRLVNQQRAAVGCPALTMNSQLLSAAQQHNSEQAQYNYSSHAGRDGSSPDARISRAGYQFSWWSENIAWGQRTPQDVVNWWMNSPGHRANILNCNLRDTGIAHNVSSNGTPYWTEDFGTPR